MGLQRESAGFFVRDDYRQVASPVPDSALIQPPQRLFVRQGDHRIGPAAWQRFKDSHVSIPPGTPRSR